MRLIYLEGSSRPSICILNQLLDEQETEVRTSVEFRNHVEAISVQVEAHTDNIVELSA